MDALYVKYLAETGSIRELVEHLLEGKYDPYRLKAFFLAGGPGSGKSYVRQKLFPLGVKTVDIDVFFEYLTRVKKGLDKLANVDYTSPEFKEIYERSKQLLKKLVDLYIKNSLGIVFDTTGRKFETVKRMKDTLEKFGYDTYMIYVYTDLEKAKERNKQRRRSLDEKIVEELHREALKNIPKYKEMFKGRFMIIDNTEDNADLSQYQRKIEKWLKE